MGTGILLGQETKLISKVNMQTLQSAYKNGVLANAKEINTKDSQASINRPHLVNSKSTNIPDNLSWGIREIFFYDNENVIIQITGVDMNNIVRVWYCSGSSINSVFTIGAWLSLEPPITGTETISGLTKLYSSMGDDEDGTLTRKALNEQFAKYLETDKLNNYLTVFQDTKPEEGNAVFWVNTTSDTTTAEQITVPQINDSTNTSFDTWSSKKINNEFGNIGRYMVFGGDAADVQLTNTNTHYIPINHPLVNQLDADEYISNNSNGYIVLKKGIYLVAGKIQLTNTSTPVSIIASWMSSTDGNTFQVSYETQVSESYVYIGSTDSLLHAKLLLNPMVVIVSDTMYLRAQVQLRNTASVLLSQQACRFQVTKLK